MDSTSSIGKVGIFGVYILSSIGALLQITGGFWDVTWHGLQRPETFFTPPHIALYAGVGTGILAALGGFVLRFLITEAPRRLKTGLNMLLLGSILQGLAGGFDFWWHSTFGLDGLLSPPHLMLVIGMFSNGLGATVGMGRLQKLPQFASNPLVRFFTLLAFAALWLSSTGLVYMFTLPFSESPRFNLNPDPLLGAVATTLLLPMIGSAIMLGAIKTIGRAGTATSLATIFVFSNMFSTILSNPGLNYLIPLYLVNVFVGVAIDIVLLRKRNLDNVKLSLIIGVVFGLAFFTLYFPVDVHAYREIFGLSAKVRMRTDEIFLKTYQTISPAAIIPGAVAGFLGGIISSKLFGLWGHVMTTEPDIAKAAHRRQ